MNRYFPLALSGLVLLAACGPATSTSAAHASASAATSGAAAGASGSAAGTASVPSVSPVPTCSGAKPPVSQMGVLGTASALTSVEFVSPSRGWVAGAGRILATSDGGRTWRAQYHGPAQLDQIDFTDAAHGWATGTNALLTTANGGATWTALPEPCGFIQSVHFVSPRLGYAIAAGSDLRLDGGVPAPVGGGELLATTDGGRHWLPVRGAPARAQTVCFTNAADGYLGTPGRIWRSTDGGAHWSVSFTEPPRHYGEQEPGDTSVLECAGNTAAWVLFLGFGAAMNHAPYVAYTTQDARHWHALLEEAYLESTVLPEVTAPDGPGSYPGPFSAIDPDTAVFLGWTPPVGPDGVAPLDLVTGGHQVTGKGNVGGLGEPFGAAFISAAQGWVVGTSATDERTGVIEATGDGGRTWTRQYRIR